MNDFFIRKRTGNDIIKHSKTGGGGDVHFVEAKGILTGRMGKRGMNIYRGCSHGCIYCDSRSRCYQFSHPFEDIEVKRNAPALLEQALRTMRKRCMIGTGSMSDPYMHCETDLRLTRSCLEMILKYGFGATVLTKSDRILRDIDLLEAINNEAKCVVQMTLTTWDEDLCRVLEPGVCCTQRRVEVLARMRERGIPTIVWLTPILPFINDTEKNILPILNACSDAGVRGIVCFDMGMTLREGNREYFYAALDRHFPGMKEQYIRIFGNAYSVPSPNAQVLMSLFRKFCTAREMLYEPEACFAFLTELPDRTPQLSMFDP